MNNLIQLKGTLNERKSFSTPGRSTFSKGQSTTSKHLEFLKNNLEMLYSKWSGDSRINGALVSVYYNRTVPKSKRIKTLLSKGSEPSNLSIKGARFSNDGQEKHIITHFISCDTIKINIKKLDKCIKVLNTCFNGEIDNNKLKEVDKYKSFIENNELTISTFINVVTDACNVEKFDILNNTTGVDIDTNDIISLYDIGVPLDVLMEQLGLTDDDYVKIYDNNFRFKNTFAINKFKKQVPYLISMSVADLAQYDYNSFFGPQLTSEIITIPKPNQEPVVGVIDTLFDENVYFKDWVNYKDLVDKDLPRESCDYEHGTAVTSIIVDGPSMNPQYDDGCGRFRVRHFGVAIHGKNSSLTIMRNIEEIIKENPDIHVWNLSLGSSLEINENFISPEAALLDRLQSENNIIFVISGTNDGNTTKSKKIGAPADSINGIVVNSLDFQGEIPSYARKGKVLSFFNKPDICYLGGDDNKGFVTCVGTGEKPGIGTSFAAPWIARKMAYLIDILGLTRETAKAILIDSATSWQKIDNDKTDFIGFGQVPININDIIHSKDDEIKFYIEGTSNMYDTYTHNIPVPIYKDKYPFIAKATLCYFPRCSRNQGVDYTNTELDVYFGRIDNKGKIKSINENAQSEGETTGIKEQEARKNYRKWDNVKHITQILKPNIRPKQKYDNTMWGLSIKSKERLEKRDGEGIKFGIVITLKEINGTNRISEFINQCSLRGWLVNEINVENRVDIYNVAQEEIQFEK